MHNGIKPWNNCIQSMGMLLVCGALNFGNAAWAQSDSAGQSIAVVPPSSYYSAKDLLYSGSYRSASKAFQDEWSSAFKIGQRRWVDSICFHAMLGEAYYQWGQYPEALEQYNAAIQLYLTMPNWMLEVRFPDTVRPKTAGKIQAVPWGPSTRTVKHGDFPSQVLMQLGRVNNNTQYKTGGVVEPPSLRPVGVYEVQRTLGLALRRRREMLGPLAAKDLLGQQAVSTLSGPVTGSGHWTKALVNVNIGLAYVGANNDQIAKTLLLKNITTADGYDHPLTSLALFELGRMEMQQAQYVAAARFFFEASCAAFHEGDHGMIEEALRYGHMNHVVSGQSGIYPPLPAALEWARKTQSSQLLVSLAVMMSEDQTLGRAPQAAAISMAVAQKGVGRSSIGEGRLGARLQFQAAQVHYQLGNVAPGDQALTVALTVQQKASMWLWHMRLVDRAFVTGSLVTRDAFAHFNQVLREPTKADWLSEPLESLTVQATPHAEVFDHWFLVALERKNFEEALQIADQARWHRFSASQFGGGRLQALRWLLEGPRRIRSQQDEVLQNDLLAEYPGYLQLSQQASLLREQLQAAPLVARDPNELRTQTDLFNSLGQVYAQQELLLRQMSLRRLDCQRIFPPRRSVKDIQEVLPEGQAYLDFFVCQQKMYGFLVAHDVFNMWEVGNLVEIQSEVLKLLNQWGHFEGNRPLPMKQMQDTAWQATLHDLWSKLTSGASSEFSSKQFEELVITPDNVLWYVPFEAVPLGNLPQSKPLFMQTRIRYAPLASLAIPYDMRGRKPTARLCVALGRISPMDQDALATNTVDRLQRMFPSCDTVDKKPLPSTMPLYTSFYDRLLVLDDLTAAQGHPNNVAPLPVAAGKPGCTLDGWLSLPWQGPDQILLPGFHTSAENALKTLPVPLAGQDVFHPVMSMMSSGARTVLLSRWRTGGRTSHELMREFMLELPYATAADAWQRSLLLATECRLQPNAEPRLGWPLAVDPPTADHPFFWSGYLLVDCGNHPLAEDSPADIPSTPGILHPLPAPPLRELKGQLPLPPARSTELIPQSPPQLTPPNSSDKPSSH